MSFTWSAAIRCGCLAHSLSLSLSLPILLCCQFFLLPLYRSLPLTRTQTQSERVRDRERAPMEVITGQKCSNVCDLRSNNNWLQLFVVASELSMACWRSTTFCSVVVAAVRVIISRPRLTFCLFAIILCKIIYEQQCEACNVSQICIDRFEYEPKC